MLVGMIILVAKLFGIGKSLSEALLFAEHGENMLCTKIDLNVTNIFQNNHLFQMLILRGGI